MNVLISGGAGYIGSVCTEWFLRAGHSVTVYDNLSEGHRSAVDPKAVFVEGDCLDASRLRTTLRSGKIDTVVHLAAVALVGESMRAPGKYFVNNAFGTQTLLEACVNEGVRKVVFSSTCATYGIPLNTSNLDENHPQQPVNPYGESKRMVERMLDWYQRIHSLEYVAFRFFNAAGASAAHGEHHRVETHLIPNVLKVALGQAVDCDVFGTDYPTPDGTCLRDYVHVEDLAQAHLAALDFPGSGFFNLGNEIGCSVLEVLKACESVTGRKIPFRAQPRRPGDPPRLVASAAKARQELGWSPRHAKLEEIIDSAWKWHCQHPSGYPD
jgi:UDP-glucose 4-epimerase